ncbi:MAG: hypothetical protein L0H64_12295 [Pseudonocardia sp.]|nr:hypothetical protein [Pseudonocardia sp.]
MTRSLGQNAPSEALAEAMARLPGGMTARRGLAGAGRRAGGRGRHRYRGG